LGLPGGSLAAGEPADFFTVDLNDLLFSAWTPSRLRRWRYLLCPKARSAMLQCREGLFLRTANTRMATEIRARYGEVQRRYTKI